MALKCESCGVENPATNRYCGHCGRKLAQTATDTPEEFWRDAAGDRVEHREAAADLSPEVIDFDNQIPLIAGEGLDRRIHPPAGMLEQIHDQLGREAELHDELEHGNEPHHEAIAKQEVESDGRDKFLSWEVNPVDDAADETASPAPTSLAPTNSGAAPPVAHRNFLPEGEKTRRTGVSGPSFLGLNDDDVPEDDDEEPETESHLRRNVALAVLIAVAVLAAVQWRSIRDYGLAYVQNGSMAVKQSAKGAPRNSPAVAADNTSRDLGIPPATSKAGSPQAVESSPNADHPLDVQQARATQQPGPPTAAAPAARKKQPPAMSAQAADVPKNAVPTNAVAKNAVAKNGGTLDAGPKDAEAENAVAKNGVPQHDPPASAIRSAGPRPFRAPVVRSVGRVAPVPGSDEMSRAVKASNAEARAVWLWRAVGKGNPQAPVELAKMYERGSGVVRSCDQAKVLLRTAAAKGNAEAKLNLQQIRIRGGC